MIRLLHATTSAYDWLCQALVHVVTCVDVYILHPPGCPPEVVPLHSAIQHRFLIVSRA